MQDSFISMITDQMQEELGLRKKHSQAIDLQSLKKTTTKKTTAKTEKDNLKKIEGIGPKIEKLLKDAGINNWSDLANADVEKLKAILNKAGSRYQIHDPSTWPMQAQKAVDGKWEELKEYQDFLDTSNISQYA